MLSRKQRKKLAAWNVIKETEEKLAAWNVIKETQRKKLAVWNGYQGNTEEKASCLKQLSRKQRGGSWLSEMVIEETEEKASCLKWLSRSLKWLSRKHRGGSWLSEISGVFQLLRTAQPYCPQFVFFSPHHPETDGTQYKSGVHVTFSHQNITLFFLFFSSVSLYTILSRFFQTPLLPPGHGKTICEIHNAITVQLKNVRGILICAFNPVFDCLFD